MKSTAQSDEGRLIAGIRDVARRGGVELSPKFAKTIAREVEPLRARRHVRDVLLVMQASEHSDAPVSFATARRLLAYAGGDLRDALHRAATARRTEAGTVRRETLAETAVIDAAAARGIEIGPNAAARWLRVHGGVEGAIRHADDVRRVLDAAEHVGWPLTLHGALIALNADPADVVIDRVRARAERRRARWARACTVTTLAADPATRERGAFGCRCARCEHRLGVQLLPYQHKLVGKHAIDPEEGMAVAREQLSLALDKAPAGIASFTPFYGGFLARELSNLQRRDFAEPRALSLDAPAAGTDGATFADAIPDRTISVETIVILRERLRERVAETWQRIASAGEAFDSRVTAGAVA